MHNFYTKISGCFLLGITLILFMEGCSPPPVKESEIGPTGKPVEEKINPPLQERFYSAPVQLYDLEIAAGKIFNGITHEDWEKANAGQEEVNLIWQETKALVNNKKGISSGDEAIEKLSASIEIKDQTASQENLNQFMANASDIGKSYKLSPISDIISINNVIRSVNFFVDKKDWLKASSKVREADNTWGQVKPSLEQIGILGEVTKCNLLINQLRDAVEAENKTAADKKLSDLNTNLGHIREFYRGK